MKVTSVPFKIKKPDPLKSGPVSRWTAVWGKIDKDNDLTIDTQEFIEKPTNAELQESVDNDDPSEGWELLAVLQVTK